jgi:Nicotianamine synthase protein
MSVTASRTAEFPPDIEVAPAAGLCDRIVRLHDHLRRLDNLAPAREVNALFQELVQACVDADDRVAPSVLADARVRRLRPDLLRLCSQGESLLEQAWAHLVLEAADPRAELGRFTYLENYRQLSRLEVHTLAGAGHVSRPGGRVCFLGGGPLPLSALLMHRELGAVVDVVDNDPQAADLARRLLNRLAPGPGVRVVQADARSAEDMARLLAGCDVVVVAALVGHTRCQKREVLRAVGHALDPGAHMVVRSAHGLRSLLYAVVEPADVAEAGGCVPQVVVHPLSGVVNSVLVARRRC